MKVKINLVTMSDINELVKIATDTNAKVRLTDGDGFVVNAKSLIGAIYSMEWDEVWLESDADIYSKISKFII